MFSAIRKYKRFGVARWVVLPVVGGVCVRGFGFGAS